jgi:hypothetical protein
MHAVPADLERAGLVTRERDALTRLLERLVG